jgi:SAM-dependent methyltransferase
MTTVARYDGFADWYDERMTAIVGRATGLLVALAGDAPGRCLEIGCGGGIHLPELAGTGWSVLGVDLSRDQLRVARRRVGRDAGLVLANGARLPFQDRAFEAVVAAFIHTDVDDWPAVVREAARVLRPGGRFVYVGTHPCFVGPFSRYASDSLPVLHEGYRRTDLVKEGPGIGDGVWRRVGGRHLPLALLLSSFLDAGLTLEYVEEPGPEDFPRMLALAARR